MNQTTNDGTPKTLEDVVIHIACFRPPENTDPMKHWRGIIQDYLEQKFGVAMMKTHTAEQQAILEDLWLALTGERLKK